MLILLRQTPTGIYAYPPEIPENEVCNAVYFDTATQTIFASGTIGGGSFEMAAAQLVWTDPDTGDQYLYDGDGGVTLVPGAGPAPVDTFSLTLQSEPRGSTLPVLSADPVGPHPAGTAVAISILPGGDGWEFRYWSINGTVISYLQDFEFTTLDVDTVLVAHFQLIEGPPAPGPSPDLAIRRQPVPKTYFPLEIRVNGVQIPITAITSKIHTGIFSNELEGDYHLPINIPMTDQVMTALKLPNDPQSIWEFSEGIPAELWSHGNRLYGGFLEILKAEGRAIRTTFVFDSGFFIEKNKQRSIRDCYEDSDFVVLDEPKAAVGGHELRFLFRDVRLTVNGTPKLFLKASYEEHIQMLEAMAAYLESLPLNLTVSIQYSDDLTDEQSRIIAWDTNIVTTITLQVTTGTSRFTRARRLTNERLIMDAWAEVDETKRIAFPTIFNKELYEGNNPLHDGIVNRYDNQGRLQVGNVAYLTFAESFRWENTLIPFLYLTDIVRTIFRKLNIEVSGSFFDDDRVKRMLVYNNRTLDAIRITENGTPIRRTFAHIIYGENFPDQDAVRYQNVMDFHIQLRNHVPDYSIIDFLKAMKNYFALKYDFNLLQNRVEIRFIRDIIRSMESLDLTRMASRVYVLTHGKEQGLAFSYEYKDPLLEDGQGDIPEADFEVGNYLGLDGLDSEIGQTAYVWSLKAYFTLTADQENPPFWKLAAFVQRDEESENKRPWSIGMVPLVDGYFGGRKMPAIEMTGRNPDVNLANEDTGIRIFAYYGRQQDASGSPYLFASCTRYNAKEIPSPHQYDLDIRSEDSTPFWKDLEYIIDRGKMYETTVLVDEITHQRLSKTKRIRIANIDYLIDRMEITHTDRDYALARLEMWKVNLARPANRPDPIFPRSDGFDYDLDFDLD